MSTEPQIKGVFTYDTSPLSNDKMSESKYKIQKLKGAKNIMRWKEDIKAIFVMKDMWEVVIGEELEPISPTLPSTIATSSTATVGKSPEQHEYEVEKKEWEKERKTWRKTNNKAKALLILLVEDGPRAHIIKEDQVFAAWAELIKMYRTADLATRDQALYEISRIDSDDFRSISEYSEHIKKHAKTLVDMDVGLPTWMLSTFFRLGLKEDLEPYVFNMIQQARNNKVELEIDDLTIALVEHDKRVSQSEDSSKAMAAKFGKQNKPTKNKGRGGDKERCEHCDWEGHSKDKCYYLCPNLRPEG